MANLSELTVWSVLDLGPHDLFVSKMQIHVLSLIFPFVCPYILPVVFDCFFSCSVFVPLALIVCFCSRYLPCVNNKVNVQLTSSFDALGGCDAYCVRLRVVWVVVLAQ